MEIVGAVLSTMTVRSVALPVLPAASAWVASAVYVPSALIAAKVPDAQVPAEQVAEPERRPIDQLTAVRSPLAVPHVPEIEVTSTLVE